MRLELLHLILAMHEISNIYVCRAFNYSLQMSQLSRFARSDDEVIKVHFKLHQLTLGFHVTIVCWAETKFILYSLTADILLTYL